ncbi:major facilitator superfamily domain-containing protein [Fennellomyces sp. T-0311]|nr:major facilitator superfamily domain-containing protein [Fennellomyces sp. T-0311]
MTIATAASAGIAASPTIGVLIAVRMLQAVGVSAIQTVGFGVATDISVPATRAGYLSYFQMAFRSTTLAGPVLGGAIAQHLSWRWCFWIAFFFGLLVLIHISLLFPETLPPLLGGYYNPTPIQWITNRKQQHQSSKSNFDIQRNRFKRMPEFRDPYRYLLLPDFLLVMLLSGLYVGAQGTFNISMTYLFHDYYNLQEQDIGLCFLPQTIGSIIGAICAGRVLNARFRKAGKKFDELNNNTDEKTAYTNKLPLDFPLHRVRLGSVWPNAIAAPLLTALHGWVFEIKAHLAVPLVIEFCVSFNIMFITGATKALLGDLRPEKASSVSASNCLIWNLFVYVIVLTTCQVMSFALTGCFICSTFPRVIGSMTIYPVTKAIGPGWTYTVISLLMMVFNLAIVLLIKFGPKWRAGRQESISAPK